MKQAVRADVQAALREEAEEREENLAYLDSFYTEGYPEEIFEHDNEPEMLPEDDQPYDPRDYYPEEEWPTWREDNFGEFGP